MPGRHPRIRWVISAVAVAALAASIAASSPLRGRESVPVVEHALASNNSLEHYRNAGDLESQRRHVWATMLRLTTTRDDNATFDTWHGENAVFGPDAVKQPAADSDGASAPVLTYTLYNQAAYEHIRRHVLYRQTTLESLRIGGEADDRIADNRTVPVFPADAVVLKTVWWPIAQDRMTALPVWDPESNPRRHGGNDFISWQRVVAVDPSSRAGAAKATQIDFAGRSFTDAQRVDLDSLHHVVVDQRMATRITQDQTATKAVLIALGREIRPGDYLALVGAHLATKEIIDWVWATIWWHDRPDQGPYAAGRPAALQGEWRNYLLDVAFDAEQPLAQDGAPHVCFNPWLEARFPDHGHGGGTVSNCMACHRRASYPAVAILPISRGAPDLLNDPAYAPGRLRTNSLWSIAQRAAP